MPSICVVVQFGKLVFFFRLYFGWLKCIPIEFAVLTLFYHYYFAVFQCLQMPYTHTRTHLPLKNDVDTAFRCNVTDMLIYKNNKIAEMAGVSHWNRNWDATCTCTIEHIATRRKKKWIILFERNIKTIITNTFNEFKREKKKRPSNRVCISILNFAHLLKCSRMQ